MQVAVKKIWQERQLGHILVMGREKKGSNKLVDTVSIGREQTPPGVLCMKERFRFSGGGNE